MGSASPCRPEAACQDLSGLGQSCPSPAQHGEPGPCQPSPFLLRPAPSEVLCPGPWPGPLQSRYPLRPHSVLLCTHFLTLLQCISSGFQCFS